MVGFSLFDPITLKKIPVHSYYYCRRKHCIYYYLGSNTRGSLVFLVQSVQSPTDIKYEFLKKENVYIERKYVDIKESNTMFKRIRKNIRNTKYDYDVFIRDDAQLLTYFSKESRKNNKKNIDNDNDIGNDIDNDIGNDIGNDNSNSNQKNEEYKLLPRPKPRYPSRSRKVTERFRHTNIDKTNIVSGSRRKSRFKPLV